LFDVKSREISISPVNEEVGITFNDAVPVLESDPLKIRLVDRTSLPVQLFIKATLLPVENACSKLSVVGKVLI
jgi:hypothetical protein